MATWYYMANQTDRIGPLDDSGMAAVINSGAIIHTTYVFKAGETEWKRASDYPELFMKTAEAQPAIADTSTGNNLLPWTVRPINGTDGSWGVELDFSGLNADEGQKALQLIQMYHNASLSKQFPRIASGSHRQAISFFFHSVSEKPNNLFSLAPLDGEKVTVLRSVLAGMANELHAKQLGLWLVDPRLAFHADGQYHVVPSFWMPAFAARSVSYKGLAPEWRDNGSQAKVDIYAIACACFQALTGEQHDPDAKRLPGEIIPETAAWDIALACALRDDPSRRPKDLASWLAEQPQSNHEQMQIQQTKPRIEQPIAVTKVNKQPEEQTQRKESIRKSKVVRPAKKAKKQRSKKRRGIVKAFVVIALLGIAGFIGNFYWNVVPRLNLFGNWEENQLSTQSEAILPHVNNKGKEQKISDTVMVAAWMSKTPLNTHDTLSERYESNDGGVFFPGANLMSIAAGEGRNDIMELLGQSGVSFTDKDSKGIAPIHYAARKGRVFALQWLKDHGADLNALDNEGLAAIHFAALNNSVPALQWLKDNDADMHAKSDSGGEIVHWAAMFGRVAVLQWCKDSGMDLAIQCSDGKTPVHWAVQDDSMQALPWLRDNGMNIQARSNNGGTPIHWAAALGKVSALQWLKDNGADLNARIANGETAAHWAAAIGSIPALQWLKDNGAKMHAQTSAGVTPREMAEKRGKVDAARWLANIDRDGATSLNRTATAGSVPESSRHKDNNADVNAKDKDGTTAVHLAAGKGNLSELKRLKDKGADLNVRDNEGCTPVHYAAFGGNLEVLQWLKNNGADLAARDNKRNTAFNWAASSKASTAVVREIFLWLADNGVEPGKIMDARQALGASSGR